MAQELGWTVDINEEYVFSKNSPLGQDYNVAISSDKNLEEVVSEIESICDSFDVSEETYYWLDSFGHGKKGAPYDMRDLYNDMESCLEMLENLHDELARLWQGEA